MKKKIKLSNVTLIAVTSIKEDLVQDALKISSHEVEFSSIKFLTSKKPKIKFSEIEYIDVPEMNLNEYCNFLVKDLYKYFETSHCLLIQEDSFVVNPNQWKQEYLNYDYIGAPWTKIIQPIKNKNIELKNRVGNGGFSLRSKNLLSAIIFYFILSFFSSFLSITLYLILSKKKFSQVSNQKDNDE